MLIAGLMSGTSLDGVDAALVRLEGETVETLEWELLHASTVSFTAEQRERLHQAVTDASAERLCDLHSELGEIYSEAVLRVCEQAGRQPGELRAVGLHGQTVWHRPPESGLRGATLQLGDAATVAERTGCAVVSDFRSRDIAAGGQGAPLVPWVDQVLFAQDGRSRALQNIGGIGNVTRVPPRGSGEPVIAFDTGPGNALMDAAVEIATNGDRSFDEGGMLASRGRVDEALLRQLLAHPYLAAEPPKSTGREAFGRPFVRRLVEATAPEGDEDWLDLVATLTELTARSIADAYERWLLPRGIDEVVVTGGGARNATLLRRLGELLEPLPVHDGSVLGVDPDAKEALAFAVLAWAHLIGVPANLPSVTGASGARVLGSYTPGTSAPLD